VESRFTLQWNGRSLCVEYARGFECGLRQQYHELFPAHPGDAVIRPDRIEAFLHEPLQDVIADLVPVAVADGLEIVQIDYRLRVSS